MRNSVRVLAGLTRRWYGGRQLDHAVSPMRMLKAAVEAARGMPVMVDSGFRRGTDILKALALGARAVFVGRPFLFAAAYAGAVGVQHAIRLLTKEVDKDMALLGLRGIEDVSDNILLPVVSEQAITRQTA